MTEPATPRSPRRRGRRVLLVIVALGLAISAGVAAGWLVLDQRPIRPGVEGCADVRRAGPRIDCMQRRAVELAREDGDSTALERLRDVIGEERSIECHLAVHALGERAGRREGESGFRSSAREVRLRPSDPCDQGWIHGYLSVVFDDVTDEQLGRALDACATVAARVGECDHALGHAMERAHRDADQDDAVHRCELLAATTEDVDGRREPARRVHDCQHGAVMESALLDAGREGVAVDNCATVEARTSRRACYEFLVARAVLLGDDWSRAARRCADLDERADRSACDTGFLAAVPNASTCDVHPDHAVRARCRRAARA